MKTTIQGGTAASLPKTTIHENMTATQGRRCGRECTFSESRFGDFTFLKKNLKDNPKNL